MRAIEARLERLEARRPGKYGHLSEAELDQMIIQRSAALADEVDLPAVFAEHFGWDMSRASGFDAELLALQGEAPK